MAVTREELNAIAEKYHTMEALTDIDIFIEGVQVESLKSVGAVEALPYLMTVRMMAILGVDTEVQFSNEGVYAMAEAAFADFPSLKATLRDA